MHYNYWKATCIFLVALNIIYILVIKDISAIFAQYYPGSIFTVCNHEEGWIKSSFDSLINNYDAAAYLSCDNLDQQLDIPSIRANNSAYLGTALMKIEKEVDEKLSLIERELEKIEIDRN